MRALFFQHVPFEGLGSIGPYLEERGFEIVPVRFFQEPYSGLKAGNGANDLSDDSDSPNASRQLLPAAEGIDFLVVMGGPMSANDEERYPWLAAEKEYIGNFCKTGKPVLGVCLGAQLIASALGARVFRNPYKEIGWFPIHGIRADKSQPQRSTTFEFPQEITVFHWHGETFDLPEGATLLAHSNGCRNQAFQVGNSVIGLQFHLETTPESLSEIVNGSRSELVTSRYVQSESEILNVGRENFERINREMVRVLEFLL